MHTLAKILAKNPDPCLLFLQAYARKGCAGSRQGGAMAEIRLQNVCKRWGSFVGVDNFDLTIADREFLVLLGPSGCGKTTTMRMIAGLEDPSDGEIKIGERVVNELDPKDRDVAMVFQSYGLYPNMNVYDNIRFPLKVRKVPQADHDDRVMRAAEMVADRIPASQAGGAVRRPAPTRGPRPCHRAPADRVPDG